MKKNLSGTEGFASYIPASKSLPELTIKAIVLGLILSIVMAASNAYLGLKIGMTVSASIPAAVISMALLKLFRESNVLENNLVQTAATAGEGLATGVVFTLPALLMIGFWSEFPFSLMFAITVIGGILGVIFSIPLRRALVVESNLRFPEGVATAEVLKAGDDTRNGNSFRDLLMGGFIGSMIKFGQTGLQVVGESVGYWTSMGKGVIGYNLAFPAALIGAGYLAGIEVGIGMFLGNIFAFWGAVPYLAAEQAAHLEPDAYKAAVTIWNSKVRMIGVGAMAVGGIWTLVTLMGPIVSSMRESLKALKSSAHEKNNIIRTEKDIPISYVLGGTLLSIVPIWIITSHVLNMSPLDISSELFMLTVTIVTFVTLLLGFLSASIAGYMTGMLGSSINPLSGVALMVVLILSGFVMLLLGGSIDLTVDTGATLNIVAAIILMTGLIVCAASLSNDNMQDLKAGYLLGATPWKQQIMLIVGVLAGALVMAPIMQLLFEAYGMGDILPRPGMDPAHALSAPKAALIATLAKAIVTHAMDWTMFLIGIVVGIVTIFLDKITHRTFNWRIPVLSLAVGIYMPSDIVAPILMGGTIAWLASRRMDRLRSAVGTRFERVRELVGRRGMLFAAGLIAGEALMGIGIAIPFATAQDTNVLKWVPDMLAPYTTTIGVMLGVLIIVMLYRSATAVRATDTQ